MTEKWVKLRQDLMDPLLRFLAPRESSCVSFTEKLIHHGAPHVPSSRTHVVYVRIDDAGKVDGAILHSLSGLLYPVLAHNNKIIEEEAVELIRGSSRKLFSVMGRDDDVHPLEAVLRKSPVISIDYHHMAQQSPPMERPFPRLPDGLTIRTASENEAGHLFDIQRLYEIEEVLLPGNTFNASASRRHLEVTLKTQLVVVGELDGRVIAKAGTNARGLFFDQIGGVFTRKEYRSRGVSSVLMMRLLSILQASHKSASLFVKQENGPAITLYSNLGFGAAGGFRISYYR